MFISGAMFAAICNDLSRVIFSQQYVVVVSLLFFLFLVTVLSAFIGE